MSVGVGLCNLLVQILQSVIFPKFNVTNINLDLFAVCLRLTEPYFLSVECHRIVFSTLYVALVPIKKSSAVLWRGILKCDNISNMCLCGCCSFFLLASVTPLCRRVHILALRNRKLNMFSFPDISCQEIRSPL